MPRLTITLSDERHQALKEAAARQGRTMGDLIEESLELAGIKTTHEAAALVDRARRLANLTEEAALTLAVAETREARRS